MHQTVSPPTVLPITFPARPINGGPLEKALPKSGTWYYEPKYNGWRAMIHAPTGAMFNRDAKRLSIEREFAPALDKLKKSPFIWLDCEALERRHGIGRGSLFVLDCLDHAHLPYVQRTSLLYNHLVATRIGQAHNQHFQPEADGVYIAPSYGDGELTELWGQLKKFNQHFKVEFYEGIVAKRADSLYPIQLRSASKEFPFWMKHRWAF